MAGAKCRPACGLALRSTCPACGRWASFPNPGPNMNQVQFSDVPEPFLPTLSTSLDPVGKGPRRRCGTSGWRLAPLPALRLHPVPFGWRALARALGVIVQCGAALAQSASPPPAVSVTPIVSREVTETGDFIGRVTAVNKVDIVARVSGFIEERLFTEGQQVKTGDLLFRIEQATYKAAVDQQRANLAKAKAAEVNAALQLQRGRELVRNQNIPQATLDQREADEAAAKANVLQAE